MQGNDLIDVLDPRNEAILDAMHIKRLERKHPPNTVPQTDSLDKNTKPDELQPCH